MNTTSRLVAFAAVVVLGFAGAAVVGAAVGPIDVEAGGGHSTHESPSDEHPRGLAVAEAGYRLVPDEAAARAGAPSTFGFTIVDEAGDPITTFDELHERRLHLIVLSRNLVDYAHLHPAMDPSGHWTVELLALDPGSYRVFADFQPTGSANLTLATDLGVAGDVREVTPPAPATTANVDGYSVTMIGDPSVGDAELGFTVELAGEVVRTEPYLGAAGHLVAIRTGDLAYLHVHPHDDEPSPAVTFTAELPTAGTYRLFFDFAHDGVVRTASFTIVVGS